MKRIFTSSIVFAGIFATGTISSLYAQGECSNATLNGAYGFYSSGGILPAGAPRMVLGREVYDGGGNFVDTFLAINNEGTLTRTTSFGTYLVTADCKGTVSATLMTPSGALSLTIPFVIVDGGNEIDFTISSMPPILTGFGVRKKQFPDNNRVCSNATLKGVYGYYSTGSFFPSGLSRVVLGRDTYDGEGHFLADLNVNTGGTEAHVTNTGTYTVNPDCTGAISATLGGLNVAIDFVLVDSGKQIYFIISSNPASLVMYGVRTKLAANQD
jgi:hypothetical protein